MRYEGTDSAILVEYSDKLSICNQFEKKHQRQFGFIMPDKEIIVEAISVEVIGRTESKFESLSKVNLINGSRSDDSQKVGDKKVEYKKESRSKQEFVNCQSSLLPEERVQIYISGEFASAGIYLREKLQFGDQIDGPAIIVESTGTTVVEAGWQLSVTQHNYTVLRRVGARCSQPAHRVIGTHVDPVMLEIFNNLFMSIAEQMGVVLENTSHSVNIKERLDFSCAIFDSIGNLVANAPHVPVHLGSMSESVKVVIHNPKRKIQPGDSFMLNNPYKGGTHLPDITVVTPVFEKSHEDVLFYVASRGHHADIGGVTPGSMPPDSRSIEEEGVLIDDLQIVNKNYFLEDEIRKVLTSASYPVRNVEQNLADLRAQVAANEKGVQELRRMVDNFGLDVVNVYMGHVQDNAEASVKKALRTLSGGRYKCEMDAGHFIEVSISINKELQEAIVDFTGTSVQCDSNFNAPVSVTHAAVMYVFRTLVDSVIPMNEGCLRPIQIIIPDGSLLKPSYPAAVVAGNVETSQCITNALYGALGILAEAQGTMNNFTFGNNQYQYYETICGGSGAGPHFHGCDAVHTHMTNTRLTDPEVLEWRFPVRLDSFEIRPHSGGLGHFCGGNGVIRKVRFLEPMTAAILSNQRRVSPQGLRGGHPGAIGKNYVLRANGGVHKMSATGKVEMNVGDVFVIETPGGGGFGKPDLVSL